MTDREALKLALETLEGIAKANWRNWEELASPDEFERWAKSRANYAAEFMRQALEQPDAIEAAVLAEREACAKVCESLRDEDGYEAWGVQCAEAIRARGE